MARAALGVGFQAVRWFRAFVRFVAFQCWGSAFPRARFQKKRVGGKRHQKDQSSISARGNLVTLVSLPGLFSLTAVVALVILEVPRHPGQPSSSRQDSRSIIFRNRSRATQSIAHSEYNLSKVRDGGRQAHP